MVARLWSKFKICKTENNTSSPKMQLKKNYYESMVICQKSFVIKYLFPFSPNTEQQNFQQTKKAHINSKTTYKIKICTQNSYCTKNIIEASSSTLLHLLLLTKTFKKYWITSVKISLVPGQPFHYTAAYMMNINPASWLYFTLSSSTNYYC